MPIVETMNFVLGQPYDANDEIASRERQSVRHSYVSFISSIITNNVTDVLEAQGYNFKTIHFFDFIFFLK